MTTLRRRVWSAQDGQGIAEYAIVVALVLAVLIGVIRLIGIRSDQVFSQIGSKLL